MKLGTVLLLGLIFCSGTAEAQTTYYVAKDGDDSKRCSQSRPCRTIARGIEKLSSGDTLIVRGGVYKEGLDCQNFGKGCIPGGESWSKPTVVMAYPGEEVTLRPKAKYTFAVLFYNTMHHIVFDGFIIDARNIQNTAVKITQNAHHIRLKNVEIKGSPRNGILISNSGTENSDFNELINLKVHNNGTSGSGHEIYISTSNNLVDGCEIYNSGKYGIHMFDDGNNNIIKNNTIFDNQRSGIGVFAGKGHRIYNNVVFGNRDAGIYVRNDNNEVADVSILNNTVYGNSSYGIYIETMQAGAAFVKNNLSFKNSAGELRDDTGRAQEATNLFGLDPLFIDPDKRDFHLKPGSPAIDKGETLDDVAIDKDGVKRPQGIAYDIGAYEGDRSSGSAASHHSSFVAGSTESRATQVDSPQPALVRSRLRQLVSTALILGPASAIGLIGYLLIQKRVKRRFHAQL